MCKEAVVACLELWFLQLLGKSCKTTEDALVLCIHNLTTGCSVHGHNPTILPPRKKPLMSIGGVCLRARGEENNGYMSLQLSWQQNLAVSSIRLYRISFRLTGL